MHIDKKGFINYNVPISGLQPYQQQPQQYQEQPQYYDDEPGQPQYPPDQFGRPVYPGQDSGFLKWLFDFKKEAIIPLRHSWRGEEYNFEDQTWSSGKSDLRILNEDGVTWGISLIESYTNPAFIVTDLDEKTYLFRMREVSKIIWNSLCLRHKEFDLIKTDIPRVAEEIESKVSAILRGALDNGYRDFFSTQNQEVTHKNLSPQQGGQPGSSIWSKAANFFRRSGDGVNY